MRADSIICLCAAVVMHKPPGDAWLLHGFTLPLDPDRVHCCSNHLAIQWSKHSLFCILCKTKHTFICFCFFKCHLLCLAGENITEVSPDFARVKDGGLHLSIPLVTAAHEGEYTCLVKGDTTEILRTYRVRVDGKQNYKNVVMNFRDMHYPSLPSPAAP